MKTYVDMTKTQLKRECAKIFENLTGIPPVTSLIILLEAGEDRVYFGYGNITIDHRVDTITGEVDTLEINHAKGWINKRW